MSTNKVLTKEELQEKLKSTGTSTLNNPEIQDQILRGVNSGINSTKVAGGTAELVPKQEGEEDLISQTDPSAAAAALFALYGTRFYAIINSLKTNQLKRLCKALVVYPLEDQYVNTKNELEMNAYHMATKMIESRFLLTIHAAWEQEEKRKEFIKERDAKAEAEKNASMTTIVTEENKDLITNSNEKGENNV